jgi:hypothetical protein
MEYQVAADDDLNQLIAKVNHAIKNGWRPQGGISVAVHQNGSIGYFQAIVRG